MWIDHHIWQHEIKDLVQTTAGVVLSKEKEKNVPLKLFTMY